LRVINIRTNIAGLTSEHLLFSHPVLPVILSKLFNVIFQCQQVPGGFKYSYIVPVPKVKDCRNKAMTCNDFRAITISPILCKVFEYCLLDKFNNMLKTSDTQFGFKKGLSYNHAIYSVRRIIEHVVQNGSTVNLCAIDLSKVFDKVNLRALFIKLKIRLLEDMICVCFSFVKWGEIRSTFFLGRVWCSSGLCFSTLFVHNLS